MNKHLYGASLPLFARAAINTPKSRTRARRPRRVGDALQKVHTVTDALVAFGYADIDRGGSILARFVGWMFAFPAAGRALATTITIVADNGREIWHRRFASAPILTHLEPVPVKRELAPAQPAIVECFRWGVRFKLGLGERDGALRFEILAMHLGGIPIPRFLWPQLKAEERVQNGRFAFDIDIRLPWSAPLIHYRGWVEPNRLAVSGTKTQRRAEVPGSFGGASQTARNEFGKKKASAAPVSLFV